MNDPEVTHKEKKYLSTNSDTSKPCLISFGVEYSNKTDLLLQAEITSISSVFSHLLKCLRLKEEFTDD